MQCANPRHKALFMALFQKVLLWMNNLQKIEDALVEQMLTTANLPDWFVFEKLINHSLSPLVDMLAHLKKSAS